MGTRIQSHKLARGLYVSGPSQSSKPAPTPTMGSRVIYTGGDVTKSGELGKMFDIPTSGIRSGPIGSGPIGKVSGAETVGGGSGQLMRGNSGSYLSSGSGPVKMVHTGSGSGSGSVKMGAGPKKSHSGSGPNSGSGPIQPTGLITSGPLSSTGGPTIKRSGQLDGKGSVSMSARKGVNGYGVGVTSVGEKVVLKFDVQRWMIWVFGVVMLMALVIGVFIDVTVRSWYFLCGVGAFLGLSLVLALWNFAWRKRGLFRYLDRFPDGELRNAVDGQLVKVTGVVTCGPIPLESSYQRVPRCAYVSTELYEYRGWGGTPANSKHLPFTWGLRYFEKHAGDFYISDFQTGNRALVKAGSGVKVSPFVKSAVVAEINKESQEMSPNFLRWLADHNLSSDDRIMRLKEGYIQEGSAVTVFGVVQRLENLLMIIPSPEPISAKCQWLRFLLPSYIEGLILKCDDDTQNSDVIPV